MDASLFSHHCPPEPLGYALEIVLWVCVKPLSIIDQAGKDDHAEDDEKHEQGEFLGACFERVDQDL